MSNSAGGFEHARKAKKPAAGGRIDLKIEIRKLYGLHQATVCLDHGIKEPGHDWTDFTPSRFVYAFFTFNSIYSFDWESSFKQNEALTWPADPRGRTLREEEQFDSYLSFVDSRLRPATTQIFSAEVLRLLRAYRVGDPVEELRHVEIVNAKKALKALGRQLPGQFGRLLKSRNPANDFLSAARPVFKFIYGVRCNLFHGRKTRIELLDQSQRRRLLVYTAALIAANSLLFTVAAQTNIGWQDVETVLSPKSTSKDTTTSER